VLAGYRIDGLAGHGGMGVVYRATDLTLDRAVALTVIAEAIADDPGFRKRFIAESRTAASLDHPNVIPIFHAGEQDGTLFLVMRYVERDLRDELAGGSPIDPARAVRIVAQVASALDAAHARGLVHRDVKPANILLTDTDHAYLSDFGLSRRAQPDANETKTGQLLGTLNYVAPEQIRGGGADQRTDVYALGCVLFHALTGEVPFPLESEEAKMWAHVSEPPPCASKAAPGVPPALDGVIVRAMAKDAADRFQTAGDLGDAATAAMQPMSAPLPGPLEAGQPGRRSALIANALLHPFNIVLLAAMLIAGSAFGALHYVVPAAVVIYLAAVAFTYVDKEQQSQVAQRERAKQRRQVDKPKKRLDPSVFAPPIADLLIQALDREKRIRAAIERAERPYSEVSAEVDTFLTTIRQVAGRADLLYEELKDAPPGDIETRLAGLRRREPGKRDLIGALTRQLDVQRTMETQLQRFYEQMEQTLVELDLVRSRVISASASGEGTSEESLAADVRSLRDDMGEVGAGMAAAYEQMAVYAAGES
jgi:hypothetical protein